MRPSSPQERSRHLTRIESFKVTGLAGRDDVIARELDPLLNVFWGLNGSGKTTLLRILHSALDGDASDLENAPFESAEVVIYSHLREETYTRRLDKSRRPTQLVRADRAEISGGDTPPGPKRLRKRAPEWQTVEQEQRFASMAFRHKNLTVTRLSPFDESNEEPETDDLEEHFEKLVESLWIRLSNQALASQWNIQQRGTAQILRLSLTGTSARRARRVDQIHADDAYEVVRAFLREHGAVSRLGRKSFLKNYTENKVTQDIVGIIVGLNEEVAAAAQPLDRLVAVLEELFSGKKIERSPHALTITTHRGDEIPMGSLSSGERQLLYLFLEAMGAEYNTVLMDEPELSLHVDWQQRLLQSMQALNPDMQLIVATHSPEILAHVPLDNTFEL